MPWQGLLTHALLEGCLTALAAGCATFQPEPISAAAGAAALEARTLNDPRLHTFIAASRETNAGRRAAARPTSWDLASLTLAALYYHPDITVARAKLNTARAAVMTARQSPNPGPQPYRRD